MLVLHCGKRPVKRMLQVSLSFPVFREVIDGKAKLVEPWAWLRDVLTQIPGGASLESPLPHTWLQTHPEHRWTIAERRKLECQSCSND
jgi:hypothetical protein